MTVTIYKLAALSFKKRNNPLVHLIIEACSNSLDANRSSLPVLVKNRAAGFLDLGNLNFYDQYIGFPGHDVL